MTAHGGGGSFFFFFFLFLKDVGVDEFKTGERKAEKKATEKKIPLILQYPPKADNVFYRLHSQSVCGYLLTYMQIYTCKGRKKKTPNHSLSSE